MVEIPKPRFLDPTTPPTLFTLVMISAVGSLTMTIFLPSMPAIAAYFDAPYWHIQFMISGYLLVTALVQFAIGPLSDYYGRRPILIATTFVFIIASIICVTAMNAYVLLLGRFLQAGISTGLVLSRAAIRDVTPPNEAASKIGYVTMAMALIPMLAPILGGQLQGIFGWQAAFWVMSAAGCAVLVLIWRDQGETVQNPSETLWAQVKDYPALLASRRFWAYTATSALGAGSFFALLGGAPFVADQVYGLTPQEFGLYFIFTPFGYMTGNFVTGRYSTRLGINRMVVLGSMIPISVMSISLLIILLGATHPLAFFAFTISIGFGNGICLPNANVGMMNVNPRLAGSATGLGSALLTIFGAGISAFVASALTPERGVLPLIYAIIGCAFLALLAALYANKVENEVRDTPL